MAGPARGLYVLPEVDDEVLVGFEHGRPDAPFVLGALWNGKDKPPESNGDGKNDRRSLTVAQRARHPADRHEGRASASRSSTRAARTAS